MPRMLGFALVVAAPILGCAQAVIVAQDFNSLKAENHTTAPGVTLGTGPEAISLITPAATALQIVDLGAGNNALHFVSPAGSGGPTALAAFGGMSTNGMGNNSIVGSFDLRSLTVPNGSYQSFVFGVNSGTNSPGPTASVLIYLNHGVDVAYYDGATGRQSATVVTIGRDVNYRVTLLADYSEIGATMHDSYSFIITNLDASVIVYRSPTVATRSTANLMPDRMFFYGGNNNGGGSASDAYFQIDNLYFHALNTSVIPQLIGWPGQETGSAAK